jgi:hypothetical protein
VSSRAIYLTIGGVLAALLVVMLVTWNYNKSNAEALDKANQLISSAQAAGLPAPINPQRVADVLGTDGGELRAALRSDQQVGYLKTRIGVGGEYGFRPIILLNRAPFEGAALIAKTYCPAEAAQGEQLINSLKYARNN